MKRLVLVFACLLPSASAVTGVSVQGATATQAILRFAAPDRGVCTVEVSEWPGFAPLVHDVDASLFAGANLDSRPESTSSGRERVFVIGKRRAEKAANGKWYSRALQAYTQHYYRITCGGDIATGTFSTTNIVLGNTYNEPLPPDPSVVGSTIFSSTGHYAYPQFTKWDISDPTARQETLIDPDTGALIKRFAMPGDQNTANSPAGDHTIALGAAYGANWSNPNNAFADDSASATYSAAGTDWLVLPVSIRLDALQSLEVDLKAWCTGTCTDPVQVGLSVNGVTAWPTDASAALVAHVLGMSFPSSFTSFGGTSNVMGEWTPAGLDALTPTDINSRTGRVDVDRTGNVTWDSGDWFYPGWIAGSKITINNLICTLTGLTDPKHLAIDLTSCPINVPTTNQVYVANNFSLMIRKKVANTDTINVQYAKYNLTQAVAPGWSASGAPHFCSNNLTQNIATGDYGYHCVYPSNLPMVYWISATDATANYLGFFMIGSSGGADGWDNNGCANDSITLRRSANTNQELYNCVILDHSGRQVVLSCTLSSTNAPGNLSLSCSNLTLGSGGKDLGTLTSNFTTGHGPVFDSAKFGCGISGIQNGQLMINCRRSVQDTLAWILVFDPAQISNAPGCVGGGAPGCVVAAMNTWTTAPARFCGIHTLFSAGDGATNIAWVSLKFTADTSGSHAGAGPQRSNITSGVLTSTPGVPAGTSDCPAGSQGCDHVTTDGEPCNPFPGPGEGGNGSCAKNDAYQGLQDAAVGDILQIEPGPPEWVKLVAHTDATHWTIQRAIGPPLSSGPVPINHTGSGTLDLWETCQARQFNPRSDWYADGVTWDFANDPYGANISVLPFDTTHPVPRQIGVIGDGYPISTNILAPPTINVTPSPTFAGIAGLDIALEATQNHANHSQDTASASDQNWFLDARPLSGPGPTVVDPFTRVSGQLYKVTMLVIDKDNFTNIAWGSSGGGFTVLNRKLQATMAMSGTQPMVDISSAATGNIIGDTSVDSYKYCVVRFPNECRTGSVVGEAYLNAPFVKPRDDGTYGSVGAIAGQEAALQNDLCIFNSDAYLNSIVQMGYQTSDSTGALGRRLTRGLMRYRLLDVNMSVKSLPSASWVNIEGGMMVKLPPYPATDSVVRATFVPMFLTVPPPDNIPVDNVIVQFGYAENGAPDQFYCTSRKESCLAVSAAVPADPFKFPSDGADGTLASIAGVPCASGCLVAIPAISQRVVYYRYQYRDASNRPIGPPCQLGMQVVP